MHLIQQLSQYIMEQDVSCHANDNISHCIHPDDFSLTIAQIEKNVVIAIEQLMNALLIDFNQDPNSQGTPGRVAKMLVHETLYGRFYPPPKITFFPNDKQLDEMVFTKCEVKSMCSHHMQPIIGNCYIGIVYDELLLGLSKFDRIVDWFSRRGQIQEELTVQIANFIEESVHPRALGIVLKAEHFCKICRGVKQEGEMITSVMRGEIRTSSQMKNEFLTMIKMMK